MKNSDQIATGFARVSQILGSTLSEAAGEQSLSALQIQILDDLVVRGEALPVSFFARRFHVTNATVSDSIRVLALKGLVEKSPAPDDARSVLVRVTSVGIRATRQAGLWKTHLKSQIESWDEERCDQVLSALIALITAFQQEGMIATERMCVACRYFAINCDVEGNSAPYYCRFFNTQLHTIDLRTDCMEFQS